MHSEAWLESAVVLNVVLNSFEKLTERVPVP